MLTIFTLSFSEDQKNVLPSWKIVDLGIS